MHEFFRSSKSILYIPLPDDSFFVPWACSDSMDFEGEPIPSSWVTQRITGSVDAVLIDTDDSEASAFLPRFNGSAEQENSTFVFCPLRQDDRVVAALLLQDSPLFPAGGGIASFLLSLVSEISSPLLSRLFRQQAFPPQPETSPDDIASMVDDALQSVDRDTRSYLVVSVALKELLQKVSEQAPFLYQPTVERYLHAILNSMTRELGTAHQVPGGTLLLLSIERGFDYELLMHQLVSVLRSVFLSPPEFHHLVEHVRVYPKDGSNAKELLAGIL